MSVQIISDHMWAALYCSTSMVAFGPIFDSQEEAERFLVWLGKDPYDGAPADPRKYRAEELGDIVQDFRDSTDVGGRLVEPYLHEVKR